MFDNKKAVYLIFIFFCCIFGDRFSFENSAISDTEFNILNNPSLLATRKGINYLIGVKDTFKGSKKKINDFYTGIQIGTFGFFYSRDYVSDKNFYNLSSGSQITNGLYLGSSIEWQTSDDPLYNLSLTFRPFYNLSCSYNVFNITEENKGSLYHDFDIGGKFFDDLYLGMSYEFSRSEFDDGRFSFNGKMNFWDGIDISGFYANNLDFDMYKFGFGLSVGMGSASINSIFEYSEGDDHNNYQYFRGGYQLQPDVFKETNKKIVKLELQGEYQEEIPDGSFWSLFLGNNNQKTISSLRENITRLQRDEGVEGIILIDKGASMSFANREELRELLKDFKDSGKKIFASFTSASQSSYYLLSVADYITMYPMGNLQIQGFSTELVFFKKLLDKMGVDMQAIRYGKYKSAVEPLIQDSASSANIEQMNRMLSVLNQEILDNISEARHIEVEKLKKIIKQYPIMDRDQAMELGLIDSAIYDDQIDDVAQHCFGDYDIVSSEEYFSFYEYSNKWTGTYDDKIAIVYATGSIVMGKSSHGGITPFVGESKMGSETTVDLIRSAREDDQVKAIVLRVNSPGGSVLASDIILREIKLAKEVNHKKIIVSMGGAAASGGYYISCIGDRIFADKTTITGSIGVFGIFPNLDSLYRKVGITHTEVNPLGASLNGGKDLFSMHKLKTQERKIIQSSIDKIYKNFITLVSQGRNLSEEAVDSIAQGRVWLGKDALAIKLIDEIGGLKEAVNYAKKVCNLSDDVEVTIWNKNGESLDSHYSYQILSYLLPESFLRKISLLFETLDDFSSNTPEIESKLPQNMLIE